MTENTTPSSEIDPNTRRNRASFLLVSAGALLIVAGALGMASTFVLGVPSQAAEEPGGATPSVSIATDGKAPTPASTLRPGAPTPLPPPTLIAPAGSTSIPPNEGTAEGFVEAATAAPSVPLQPTQTYDLPIIEWTQEEIYALQWTCYGEVGGMQEVKLDACWSVISTVRARYAYSNGFSETDVIGTLSRPGQFSITFYTDRPGPDDELNWAVDQYRAGARGSCNGYLYFDSVPGGPSLCVIRAANGQWVEFHNGWN